MKAACPRGAPLQGSGSPSVYGGYPRSIAYTKLCSAVLLFACGNIEVIPMNERVARKQDPPVRLPDGVIRRMSSAAKLSLRSVPKQIEHLITLGEAVERTLSAKDLLDVQSGLAAVEVVRQPLPRVDRKAMLSAIKVKQESGELSKLVTTAQVSYQASKQHPGLLEQIHADGLRVTGTFTNGVFVADAR